MVDIIIIGYKKNKLTEDCIASLKNTIDLDYNIIECYGGSIAQNFNRGLAQTKTDIIGFVQDDWLFLPNKWASTLYDALNNSWANYVSAKQLYPDYSVHCAWLQFAFPNGEYFTRLNGYRTREKDGEYSKTMCEHGVPVFIKRKRALEIGGQDEGFVASQHEEPFFCMRLGYPLYVGSIAYIHRWNENPETYELKMKYESVNRPYLKEKCKSLSCSSTNMKYIINEGMNLK